MAKATSNIADKIEEAVEGSDLEASVKQLRKDVEKLIGRLNDATQTTQDAARRAAAAGVDQFKVHAEDIKAKAKDAEGRLIEVVREKPVTSIAVAAGIGFLLAMLSRR